MVYRILHLLIELIYLACPVLACARVARLSNYYQRRGALQRLRITIMAGACAGAMVCVAYAFALHGRLIFSQVLLTGYLAVSLMLLLQFCDTVLWNLSRWFFQLRRQQGPRWWFNLRAVLGLVLRSAIVFCLGLPYVLAAVMTYRPRVVSVSDPESLYQWNYQKVEFPATDGTRLAGWWIPAGAGESSGEGSQETVLLCPGANSDKGAELSLVRRLVPDGYNVLVFDFRGHGESGGQLCSYGDLERRDVLGAMRWLRGTHPAACRKVAGLGVSTGGAALLAAAADPSAEGQNIDAIAVYDTYDRLDHVVGSQIGLFLPAPLSWCVERVGLPCASAQVGSDLSKFSPGEEIKAVWPRPVLIIHGMDDEYIPFEEGESLYQSALEPKMNFWLSRCSHGQAIKSDAAARLVKECFDAAQRVI
jgi:fermentation-respiration switch protein FrsA (DUF1100 family)